MNRKFGAVAIAGAAFVAGLLAAIMISPRDAQAQTPGVDEVVGFAGGGTGSSVLFERPDGSLMRCNYENTGKKTSCVVFGR